MIQANNIAVSIIIYIFGLVISDFTVTLLERHLEQNINDLFPFSGT